MFVFTSFAPCQIVCFLNKIGILSIRLKAFRSFREILADLRLWGKYLKYFECRVEFFNSLFIFYRPLLDHSLKKKTGLFQ